MAGKETLQQYLADRILRDQAMQGRLKEYLEEMPREELVNLLLERIMPREAHLVPISIFSVRELSTLELAVKYLKENERMKNRDIAETIGRTQQVVWTTYNNAKKKFQGSLPVTRCEHDFPAGVLGKGPALEAVVSYLKRKGMSCAEIARRIHRNQRTVWTTARRAERR